MVPPIPQGEGGEQGDPMMPVLFSLGQHHSLEVVNRSLPEDEKVMAFLDDIYCCSENGYSHEWDHWSKTTSH